MIKAYKIWTISILKTQEDKEDPTKVGQHSWHLLKTALLRKKVCQRKQQWTKISQKQVEPPASPIFLKVTHLKVQIWDRGLTQDPEWATLKDPHKLHWLMLMMKISNMKFNFQKSMKMTISRYILTNKVF